LNSQEHPQSVVQKTEIVLFIVKDISYKKNSHKVSYQLDNLLKWYFAEYLDFPRSLFQEILLAELDENTTH